jgi:hypothetical protein
MQAKRGGGVRIRAAGDAAQDLEERRVQTTGSTAMVENVRMCAGLISNPKKLQRSGVRGLGCVPRNSGTSAVSYLVAAVTRQSLRYGAK